MAELEMKQKIRFKKLLETLATVEQQDKLKSEKANVYDKMLEIYCNKDIDLSRKSEMFIQVLSSAQCGEQ